ncbi:MAG: histidine--tRNA ligase [Alphaproteobacteria bacterium]|nr:histidine--tRNA ligase [Alphaproteobacteria bacterium]MBQ3117423.1 histidine--tRNA ligase [Alphaproteobacteria bacterium]MBQ6854812.1 histidine--tRNA ligase [Alphaproteobacteria bacterium]MBQ8557477.1 histidine--tRNA ligase [Alphaproteobacteria bacterium]MBR3913275.1 histidine--tRNA ligase [Alphaproteobacteria bacterium]
MAQKVTPRILSGFMELLPEEQLVFDRMKQIIANTYESFGFVALDTPVLELSEILLAKAGGETEKQIYRFTKGDTDMCMRFDLTVPLSRYVAQHQNELAFPFRRYQISKSYRGERPQRGRFREFYQADIDIVGSEKLSILYDAEIPSIIYRVLTKLGLKRFHIRMNNRKLLQGFYEHIGLSEQSAEILRIIDKTDKIGEDNVRLCLSDLGINADLITRVLSFAQIKGSVAEVLSQLGALDIDNATYQLGLSELRMVTNALNSMGVPETNFLIDLRITRGLDYYTGTVYETFADDFPSWGSICSGGRYDNLAGFYTDRKLPGVGMSIGLTRFFDVLKAQGLLNMGPKTPASVLVIPMSEKESSLALQIGQILRQDGIKTDVLGSDTKFKNKMVYANKLGVPYVVILGESEMQNQTAVLKDMARGEQQTVALDKLAPAIRLLQNLEPLLPVIKDC